MKIQDMNKTKLREEAKITHTHIKENTELKRIKTATMFEKFENR